MNSREMKELIAGHIMTAVKLYEHNGNGPSLEEQLDAQSVEIIAATPTRLDVRVLPCNSSTPQFFSIKVTMAPR